MAYNHYRNNYRNWGSSLLNFDRPPTPLFKPQSSWNGWDYFRNHAAVHDQNLYHDTFNRANQLGFQGGLSRDDAKSLHRRIYSGLVNLSEVLASDLGAAAAYEAYRMWKHHKRTLFQPLGGVAEREREALVGLAIAEATQLWQYAGRHIDTIGQRECLESAALTASRIAERVLDLGYGDQFGSHRSHRRHSTLGTGSAPIFMQHGPTAGSFGMSGSTSGFPNAMPGVMIQPQASAMYADNSPFSSPYMSSDAGLPRSWGGGGMAYPSSEGGSAYGGGSMGTSAYGLPRSFESRYPLGGAGAAHPPNVYSGSGSTGLGQPGGYPYPSNPGGNFGIGAADPLQPQIQPQHAYASNAMPQGTSAGGYYPGGQATIMTSGGREVIPAPPGSTIVIGRSKHRSRRSSDSGHHHHRRSRSSEPRRPIIIQQPGSVPPVGGYRW